MEPSAEIKKQKKIVNSETRSIQIAGSGNVAFHLARRFSESGKVDIIKVLARSPANEELFSSLSPKVRFADFDDFDYDMPVTIVSVSDDAIVSVARRFSAYSHLMVHTAGSVSSAVLKKAGLTAYGSLYPLQTFSMKKMPDWAGIPVFIHAGSDEDKNKLLQIAHLLSDRVIEANDEQRLGLHIGAVFANNFSNHLFALASGWLEQKGLSFDYLLPLIRETVHKLDDLSPYDAQTGPAVRNDDEVIKKHLEELDETPQLKEIYQLISRSIRQLHSN